MPALAGQCHAELEIASTPRLHGAALGDTDERHVGAPVPQERDAEARMEGVWRVPL